MQTRMDTENKDKRRSNNLPHMQKSILEHTKEKEEIIKIYLSNMLTTTMNYLLLFSVLFCFYKWCVNLLLISSVMLKTGERLCFCFSKIISCLSPLFFELLESVVVTLHVQSREIFTFSFWIIFVVCSLMKHLILFFSLYYFIKKRCVRCLYSVRCCKNEGISFACIFCTYIRICNVRTFS